MNLNEIMSRMISLEERINLEEHRLSLSLGNRCLRSERINNSNDQIRQRIQRLNNEWDRLCQSIHN